MTTSFDPYGVSTSYCGYTFYAQESATGNTFTLTMYSNNAIIKSLTLISLILSMFLLF